MARKNLAGKSFYIHNYRNHSVSAFIDSYAAEARAALEKHHHPPDADSNNTQKRKWSIPKKRTPSTSNTNPLVHINKKLLHLPEFAELDVDVLRPGVDRETDLAIQLLAQKKYYQPRHFTPWAKHLSEPARKPCTLPPDPMKEVLALQRELEHKALYTSNVAPRTVERPAGYAKVRVGTRYRHVDALGHRTEKGLEKESAKCTSCTVQGFECSGHRPICSQCFYSSSKFTASFGARDKSMCSYPVEAQKARAVRCLEEEVEDVEEEDEERSSNQDGRRKVVVPKRKPGRPPKISEEEKKARRDRLLFDRNLAAGVDFLLCSEKGEEKKTAETLSQGNNYPDQDILASQDQGQQEETRPTSNSTSSWIEQRFLESHDDASKLDFERRRLSRLKRKVQIDDGEDLLEITGPGTSDQAKSMVLRLRPEVTGALHEDRMHEHFLDTKNAVGAQNNNPATRLAARALERWNAELDSNESQGQVIEADLDGAHFRRVIAHSGFDRTLLDEKQRGRMSQRWTEQQLASHAERVEVWEAQKKMLKRSLPKEEYIKLRSGVARSRGVLKAHRENEKGHSLKQNSKVPKFRKRMEKSFRPWVPDRHDTVEPSQCDLPETTFLQSLHQYASYYYTHAQPCPDVFESMDLTAQIALGMIVQETISDFAYKLGKQGQVELETSDDDGDSERTESDVSESEFVLTGEDTDIKEDKEDGSEDHDEVTEEDFSDDSRKGDEDDGYMSL
ncbi:hypothetical protein MVEG_04639 [Podila verticillata NRRL 6337]|nr:hypothetical protein MVEG_04639 [Podila verticillata NRRL 6337]